MKLLKRERSHNSNYRCPRWIVFWRISNPLWILLCFCFYLFFHKYCISIKKPIRRYIKYVHLGNEPLSKFWLLAKVNTSIMSLHKNYRFPLTSHTKCIAAYCMIHHKTSIRKKMDSKVSLVRNVVEILQHLRMEKPQGSYKNFVILLLSLQRCS